MKMDQMKTTHFDKKSLIAPIIIVVLLALAIGLIIFYITNPLFNKPQEGPFVQELQLSDNNVRILYNYVSYSVDGSRNDVFVMNSSVTKENMPSKDKLYYALQFASPEDFVSTGKRDDDNNQIFNISDNKVDAYMKRFFGNNVTYSKVKKMDYTLNFSDEYKYVGTLTYSYDNKGYDTILNKIDEEDDDLYTIKVYGDLHYHNLIETRNNLTESQLKNSVFNMNEYVN